MALTSDQALTILKSRGFQLITVPDLSNPSTPRWAVRSSEGTRMGGRGTFASPEEAIEAADTYLTAAGVRDQERRAQKLVAAAERGRYFIRVRETPGTDTEGNPIIIRLFTAVLPDGTITSVRDRLSFTQAVLDMEKTFV